MCLLLRYVYHYYYSFPDYYYYFRYKKMRKFSNYLLAGRTFIPNNHVCCRGQYYILVLGLRDLSHSSISIICITTSNSLYDDNCTLTCPPIMTCSFPSFNRVEEDQLQIILWAAWNQNHYISSVHFGLYACLLG